MNQTREHRWRRALRRLLIGTAIGTGAVVLLAQPASAAVTATFTNGVLSVFGDNNANTITISRNAAGALLVNGGAVAVGGGTPTVANTRLIQVFGLGADDVVRLDEASGALPRANLFGGIGNDTLTGGSGVDMLFGQSGNDTLLGRGNGDFLFGGSEHDVLTGGDANDQVFGESGNDRSVWNPGDDTDLNEGGAGADTTEVNGGGGAEQFTTTANGTRVRFDRLNPAPFAIDIGTTEQLVLNANGGDDAFSATGNLAALITITADGGLGRDSILGGNGADLLLGGEGDDFVDGQQGVDVAFLGAGADTFQWDPGDGNDVVEGQTEADTLRFNGSGADEQFAVSANGARTLFTRTIGGVVIDADDVETIDVNAVGGADTLTVNDLAGTDVTTVVGDLAATIGGTAGDATTDTVIVNGTNGDDDIDVIGGGTSASVVGLSSRVDVTSAEGAGDALVVNSLAGEDVVTATTLPAGVIKLTIDGGADDDTLLGSQGADVVLGSAGADFVFGDNGTDVALLGTEDDVFQWEPGDGNDTVEGQAGTDTTLFFGSNAAERIDIGANGGRVRLVRDVAAVTMDLDDVEQLDVRTLAGDDDVVVNDLTGTDLTEAGIDLRGPAGGGDSAADTVTVNGTQLADDFGATGDAGGVNVFGLHTAVNVFFPEHATDRLTLQGLGGDDQLDTASLEADGIQLTATGGLGADVFLGGEVDELVNGGDGDDIAFLGAGDDTFVWNPGDDNDTFEGLEGSDTLLFNGSNVAEVVDVSANGGRVRFVRNVANVVMDLDDVETIDFRALGGADTVVVGDVSGTDLTVVSSDLGAGDRQPDNVIAQATNGDDVAIVAGDATAANVFGLAARIDIVGAETALDRLTVNALAGDDVVDASGVAAGAIQLTIDGGIDDDVLIGGDGNDVLVGGEGDDVLIGGPGNDVIDGSAGDDVEIQLAGGELAVSSTDAVTSATTADEQWLADHVRTVDGKTVVDVGGVARTLPRAIL